MDNLFNEIFKYGYHDCKITQMQIKKDSIELFFDGLYELDLSGTETNFIPKIKMIIKLDVNHFNASNYIDIWVYGKKNQNLDINEFFDIYDNCYLSVLNLYYSDFNDEILIVGGLDGKDCYVRISNCCSVEFMHI